MNPLMCLIISSLVIFFLASLLCASFSYSSSSFTSAWLVTYMDVFLSRWSGCRCLREKLEADNTETWPISVMASSSTYLLMSASLKLYRKLSFGRLFFATPVDWLIFDVVFKTRTRVPAHSHTHTITRTRSFEYNNLIYL